MLLSLRRLQLPIFTQDLFKVLATQADNFPPFPLELPKQAKSLEVPAKCLIALDRFKKGLEISDTKAL